MANFDKAFSLTLSAEGGYANDEQDKGGETYKGIARNFNADWDGWKIIDNLKKDTKNFPKNLDSDSSLQSYVKQIYKKKYWDVNNIDNITNQDIANELFDTGVNQGVKTSAIYLQQALNLLNKNQQSYKDLLLDGAIGNITLSVINNHPNQKAVLKTMNILQGKKYIEICEKNPEQEKFFYGWLNRVW